MWLLNAEMKDVPSEPEPYKKDMIEDHVNKIRAKLGHLCILGIGMTVDKWFIIFLTMFQLRLFTSDHIVFIIKCSTIPVFMCQ